MTGWGFGLLPRGHRRSWGAPVLMDEKVSMYVLDCCLRGNDEWTHLPMLSNTSSHGASHTFIWCLAHLPVVRRARSHGTSHAFPCCLVRVPMVGFVPTRDLPFTSFPHALSGNLEMHLKSVDSRLRGNDGEGVWVASTGGTGMHVGKGFDTLSGFPPPRE